MTSRILAVDYGLKRTGLAWTDPLRIAITPLDTIPTENFDDRLKELIETNELGEIVFGLPTHKDGNLTQVGQKVVKLVKVLETNFVDIKFHLVDESYTSIRASRLLVDLGVKKKKRRKKGTVDQMSAVLILKDFLNTI